MEKQPCRDCGKEISKGRNTGLCKICYARDYRKRNKTKIKPVAQKKYLRRREYFLNKCKEWAIENKERVNKVKREYYKNNAERQKVRTKTNKYFGHLKKEGQCRKCGSTENLQFHHMEPLAYDNFEILCRTCHMEEDGTLLFNKE